MVATGFAQPCGAARVASSLSHLNVEIYLAEPILPERAVWNCYVRCKRRWRYAETGKKGALKEYNELCAAVAQITAVHEEKQRKKKAEGKGQDQREQRVGDRSGKK